MRHNLAVLSDPDLHSRTLLSVTREKESTLDVLEHLREIRKRRLFNELGYSSLWEYSVKALGYSEPAASERVNAMRLMDAATFAREFIQDGRLSFSNAAKVQRFIQRERKIRGRKLTQLEVDDLVCAVVGKSARNADRELLSRSAAPEIPSERVRALPENRTELRFSISASTNQLLERVKEIRGNISLEEIFSRALEIYLEEIDPVRDRKQKVLTSESKSRGAVLKTGRYSGPKQDEKSPGQPGESPKKEPLSQGKRNSRYIPAAVRRLVRSRARNRCEYVSKRTGRRCECRTKLQIDHIHPFARGGDSGLNNLRLLCPSHNLSEAFAKFGSERMSNYVKT